MMRRTFLKLVTGALVGGAVSACGGHDGGGIIEPDPSALPATRPAARETPKPASVGRVVSEDIRVRLTQARNALRPMLA